MSASAGGRLGSPQTIGWEALGSTVTVHAPHGDAGDARAAVTAVLEEVDAVASRFRDDSELALVNRRAGQWTAVSAGLLYLIRTALRAAQLTGGAVDPTLGADLAALGYDRDLAQLARPERSVPLARPRQGRPRRCSWRSVEVDADRRAVRLPEGTALDLGATAKGLAADRCARAAHDALSGPVLVSLGGDIATAGPAPEGGWAIAISEDHRDDPATAPHTVLIPDGALASSGLRARRWWHDGRAVHHILDPVDGRPVSPRWALASVVATTCLEANVAATAAIVLGDRAPWWLADHRYPARLVAADHTVEVIGGWPA